MSAYNKMITNAANERLPSYVQNMIWYILEQAHRYEAHHFEFDVTVNEAGQSVQKIVYTYDIPAYYKEHLYPDEIPIKLSVVVKVESSCSQTIMLAEETEE